ncbi:MarR family winged helix-turn-helix transcriptional regulator [Leptospira meyeri]|uniref:MarR family winged helix-turn-helix transcriptional regulator n=1 Tax=Leptospira meyeri TaxID=29508 RepID=UPI000C297206|nr:MarR family transcriptional regulator [Leptospira meyeri]MCW7487485.1 MarR family transcriptional regulator [Leptospira meyeri]PJZ80713.1 MarR family transcriptional regulator [Leptospira meyeri]PJZ96216.1 MarR family transcriptional regulator [Leptospira meyeri]PKA11821.1 MarR family transcriptional regulator [Leptospira meyeri]TGL13313.1 MarR family transcriptional regulator [Leptospira meyeri]
MKSKEIFFWNPETTPTFWINQVSRLLMWHFEQKLRPYDIGMAYLPVLLALEENGPLLQKQLAELAHVEQPTMAALLVRMERDGLIIRKAHPTDKRASYIALSNKAEKRIPVAKEQMLEVAKKATNGIKESDNKKLISLLQLMVQNLE